MAEDNENSMLGSFGGIDIKSLEKDFALMMPKIGESQGREKKEPDEGTEKKTKTNLDLGFMSQKMSIPETPEEIQAAKGEIKPEDGEVEKEVKDPKKQDKGGEDAIIKEDSPLYLHAATLHEEGILPTLNLENLKGKSFKEGIQIIKDEQKKFFDEGRNAYLNSLSDRQKEFLEMIELGIPQEQVEHQISIEDAYSKVTDQILSDDVELQKQIITQGLKLKGLSDTKVQVFLKAAEDSETLFEEAKDARDDINVYIAGQKQLSIDTAKNAQIDADKKELDLQKEIKSTIEKIEEILPGIKVSAEEKTKLYEYMTKPVEERIINGRKIPIDLINKIRMEDRVKFDLKLKYFIHLGLFKDDNKDLSKIVKKITSSNADKLAERLKEEPSGTSGKGISFTEDKDKNKTTKIIFPQFM